MKRLTSLAELERIYFKNRNKSELEEITRENTNLSKMIDAGHKLSTKQVEKSSLLSLNDELDEDVDSQTSWEPYLSLTASKKFVHRGGSPLAASMTKFRLMLSGIALTSLLSLAIALCSRSLEEPSHKGWISALVLAVDLILKGWLFWEIATLYMLNLATLPTYVGKGCVTIQQLLLAFGFVDIGVWVTQLIFFTAERDVKNLITASLSLLGYIIARNCDKLLSSMRRETLQ